ncbi:MAG: pilus assembly protein PilY [Azonexaceae bacterium]|nr:pilus assembly protein PilY [Azonexaceae bacterium]
MTSLKFPRLLAMLRFVAVCSTALLASMCVDAASTDIANEPLITKDNITAKPNIMFILDSSGSMDSEYMPDDMSDTGSYGYWSSQCNGLAYNPNYTYKPPVTSTPTDYANSSFSAAPDDGFATGGSTTNLANTGVSVSIGTSTGVTPSTGSKTFNINSSSLFLTTNTFVAGESITLSSGSSRRLTGTVTSWSRTSGSAGTLVINVTSSSGSTSSSSWSFPLGAHYYNYSGSQGAMGWSYTGSAGVVDSTTTFYAECMAQTSGASSVFTLVKVNAASADATNYANWYTYYRKRTLLMRTAVGHAFSALDSGYRIGFTSIRDTGITDGTNNFRDVKTFDATQKSNFYSSLYAESANDWTPLRASLSKVGRYFAKSISGQTYDPMEYSCQRNYAILSTDGYWNTNIETSTYAPFRLDGSTNVGNQDASESRPMHDGATAGTIQSRTKYDIGRLGRRRCSATTYSVAVTPQTSTDSGTTWVDGSTTTTCESGTHVVNGSTVAALSNSITYSAVTYTDGIIGGSTDSLADVAEYFYKTDLRTSSLGNCSSSTSGTSRDVCENSLRGTDRDAATWQHMTTYTIGLGVSGTLAYDKNYLTQTSGSYKNLTTGAANWPVPYDGAGAVNIDDLWHAAVDGRGQYYSALNADELKNAISGVVTSIQEKTGAASAASTNTLELVAGANNYVYQASYTTSSWVGDVKSYKIDAETAVISSTSEWSAKDLLDATTPSSRAIYFNKSGTLTSFAYSNMTAGQKSYFDGLCSKTVVSSQCSSLSSGNLTDANDGTYLVNFLRGDRTKEDILYRKRSSVLGDIVSSTPVYVGPPLFGYTDTGYAAFKSASASRTHMIYVGANDGMLHAFYASGTNAGKEAWAFIPTAVMPNLYKLADSSYGSRHAYFVDGTPVIGDVYVGGAWKTILVGGLNGGGKGYYALDITTPESPVLLWEFSDTNLGLSYGNPIIAKRADGTWVVALTSGYNNMSGDGQGHLFIVDAGSGILLLDIPTLVGSSGSPSGLAKINAWIADSSNNTALRYYGGDLFGNLWRFDVDNLVLPHQSAQLLASFATGTGTAQPITVPPRLKEVNGSPVVIVGTGRYLGTADITDTTTQTIAAFKETLTNSGWGDIRTNSTMVQQTYTVAAGGATVGSSTNSVDWTAKNGWWFDLPTSGERIVTPLALSGNTIFAGSALPTGDACVSGGASRLYTINLLSGSGTGEAFSNQYLIVGLTVVTTSDGSTKVLVKDSSGVTTPKSAGPGATPGGASSRRTSWRELID